MSQKPVQKPPPRKIAAICAYPTNLNPGMLSVDMALKDVVGSRGMAAEIVFFSVEAELKVSDDAGALHYRHLRSLDQLAEFDVILHWGDFLQWIGYGAGDFVRAMQRRYTASTEKAILELWYRLFLLETSPDLRKRSVVFGSTIYAASAQQMTDARYLRALKMLYGEAKLVRMRDALSAAFVSQLLEDDVNHLGCDCALLLDRAVTAASGPAQETAGYVLCALGRSGSSVAFGAVAQRIAAIAKKKLVVVNWLDNSGLPGLRKKLGILKGADYVLTDIYHLAVSSLRAHKPTLCFGRTAAKMESTLDDKKKEILFSQFFAYRNYVSAEEVLLALSSDAKTVALAKECFERLSDAPANDFVFGMVDRSAARGKALLQAAIFGA